MPVSTASLKKNVRIGAHWASASFSNLTGIFPPTDFVELRERNDLHTSSVLTLRKVKCRFKNLCLIAETLGWSW